MSRHIVSIFKIFLCDNHILLRKMLIKYYWTRIIIHYINVASKPPKARTIYLSFKKYSIIIAKLYICTVLVNIRNILICKIILIVDLSTQCCICFFYVGVHVPLNITVRFCINIRTNTDFLQNLYKNLT